MLLITKRDVVIQINGFSYLVSVSVVPSNTRCPSFLSVHSSVALTTRVRL